MRETRCAILVGALLLAACQSTPEWSYEGATGPEYWAFLNTRYVLAKEGKSQSPIDLATAVDGEVGDLRFDYRDTPLHVENTGRTIRVPYTGESSITLDGERYQLIDVRFRSPSEHTFGGKTMPMEVQLVHESGSGALAVVAIFLGEGAAHAELQKIWDHIPSLEGEDVKHAAVSVNATRLLPDDKTVFRYAGSLTTPPCTESVQWLVLKHPVEASEAQIKRFRAFYYGNTRPVQQLHARTIRVGGS